MGSCFRSSSHKPLPESVTEGRIQPWFEQPGGALQYKFGKDIDSSVKNEWLGNLDATS
ncbi:glycohydrolase toxin TNT-related protein [Janibacter anophelis]|uniref:glycohydrolase toxin TNT-related protein n=1 Tax=Janibacter anophelis TaxID=319054 RepID=UPI000A0418B0